MKKNNLYQAMRNLSLITQVGLSVITPLFLCVFLGEWVDRTFRMKTILFFLFLGLASGIWSTIKMFQKILARDAKFEEEIEHSDKAVRENVSVPKPKSRVYREKAGEESDG